MSSVYRGMTQNSFNGFIGFSLLPYMEEAFKTTQFAKEAQMLTARAFSPSKGFIFGTINGALKGLIGQTFRQLDSRSTFQIERDHHFIYKVVTLSMTFFLALWSTELLTAYMGIPIKVNNSILAVESLDFVIALLWGSYTDGSAS